MRYGHASSVRDHPTFIGLPHLTHITVQHVRYVMPTLTFPSVLNLGNLLGFRQSVGQSDPDR